MPRSDIARQRLFNQGLVKPTLRTAIEVVSRLGAVQAQDYGGSKWGIAERTNGLTDAEIEKEIDEGNIVRTHVLRPTWHFVAADDIGWMLALSAPRVHAANAFWYRWLEVDDALARRSRAVLTKALRDKQHRTRAELGQVLTGAKIPITSPQRLACIMMRAELDGVVCSGPRRGKQATYALLDERVTSRKSLDREAALCELAHRYFTTRGPASISDFAWWSGLTKADAKRGVESATPHLEHATIDGQSYFFPAASKPRRLSGSLAHLLPNYDEYFVGFKDRTAFSQRVAASGIKPRIDALAGHVLTVNGQIVGGWRRAIHAHTLLVEPKPLVRLSEAERRAVGAAARRFGRFLEITVDVRLD